jgi:Flp pilus assembly protein TadG
MFAKTATIRQRGSVIKSNNVGRRRRTLCVVAMLEIMNRLAAVIGPFVANSAIGRFAQRQGGVAAVEFALVAAPFLGLTFAILESGMVLLAGQTLQTAVAQSARQILTGQAQTQGLSAAQFQQVVCANVSSLFNCSSVYVNVQTYSSFSSVSMLNPVQNGSFNTSMNYIPGGPGDIVVVQLFYQWPIVVPVPSLANLNGGSRLLVATAAFRNEPYQTGP